MGAIGLAACGDDAPTPPPHVALTDERTHVPKAAREDPPDPRSPAVPEERAALVAGGLGDEVDGPGDPYVTRVLGGADHPAPSAHPTLLVRFAHFADLQLADDESPARVCSLDLPGRTDAAYRPHEAYGCRMVDAMVRTFNAIDGERPIDFVLMGGDNVDNAQQNELDWLFALMDGGPVDCDSGLDDDPVPGPGNDPKDPFTAAGLGAIPWYWVTGNHDALVQGNVAVSDDLRATAVGSAATLGTVDWRLPGAPVVTDDVPADARRVVLAPRDTVAAVAADGDGHGLGPGDDDADGDAHYSFDVPGTRLRFVVIDTSAKGGGAPGVVRQAKVDTVIRPLLDQALSDGKWAVLAAHHSASSLGDGSDFPGTREPDAITSEAFVALVTGYPNVILSMVGHSHRHRIGELDGPTGSVFEVMTASLADFPHQSRLVEIWDEGGGWLRVHTTAIDFELGDDPLLATARRLGVMDWASGWAGSGASQPGDRNADLWIPAPP
ncbi:MAG: metallophosphoesterase [Myxococcota bacterium]